MCDIIFERYQWINVWNYFSTTISHYDWYYWTRQKLSMIRQKCLNDINDLMCDIVFLQQSVIMIDIIGLVKNYQWSVKNVWTISIIKSMIIITLFFWQKSRNVWTISFITSVIINDSLKYVFRILDWNIKSLFKPANDNVFCNNSISNMIILLF